MTVSDEYQRLVEWSSVLDESSYYEILGLDSSADASAIRQAFHDFARAFHPDNHVGAAADVRDTAKRVFQRGAEAYRVLIDSRLRAKYDLAAAQGLHRLQAGEIPKQTNVAADLQSLESICKTDAAKLCARKADDLLTAGDLGSAKRELRMALYHDGNDNPALEERIDAVDLALFAMGE